MVGKPMSMENGFELDFPGDDDNAEVPTWPASAFDCDFGCMPMDHGIGEPDAASLDLFANPKPRCPEGIPGCSIKHALEGNEPN